MRGSRARAFALDDLPEPAPPQRTDSLLLDSQQAFGYTQEDLKVILAPMGADRRGSDRSMGNDAALPVLSDRPKVLFGYFKQLFRAGDEPADRIRSARSS